MPLIFIEPHVSWTLRLASRVLAPCRVELVERAHAGGAAVERERVVPALRLGPELADRARRPTRRPGSTRAARPARRPTAGRRRSTPRRARRSCRASSSGRPSPTAPAARSSRISNRLWSSARARPAPPSPGAWIAALAAVAVAQRADSTPWVALGGGGPIVDLVSGPRTGGQGEARTRSHASLYQATRATTPPASQVDSQTLISARVRGV